MYQQITLVGNLGSDPEMRYTPSGVPVASFPVAVNRQWTSQDGQRQSKTTWFRVTAWRRQAEVVSQYLTKGRQVLVIGELEEPNVWTDNEGTARAGLEVTAQVIKFIGGRDDAMDAPERSTSASAAPSAGETPALSDEDIPF